MKHLNTQMLCELCDMEKKNEEMNTNIKLRMMHSFITYHTKDLLTERGNKRKKSENKTIPVIISFIAYLERHSIKNNKLLLSPIGIAGVDCKKKEKIIMSHHKTILTRYEYRFELHVRETE